MNRVGGRRAGGDMPRTAEEVGDAVRTDAVGDPGRTDGDLGHTDDAVGEPRRTEELGEV